MLEIGGAVEGRTRRELAGHPLGSSRGADRLGEQRGQRPWHEAAALGPNAVLSARTESKLLERGMCQGGRGLLPGSPCWMRRGPCSQAGSVAQRAFVTHSAEPQCEARSSEILCICPSPLTIHLGGTGPPQPANRPRGE